MCLSLCAEIRSDTKPCTPDTGPAEEGQIMSSLKVDQNITLSVSFFSGDDVCSCEHSRLGLFLIVDVCKFEYCAR